MGDIIQFYNGYSNIECSDVQGEKLELMFGELGESPSWESPSLLTVVITFYKYGAYQALDCLYENYNSELCSDYYMEAIFLNLAKLGEQEKFEYFYKKNKDSLDSRGSFDKFQMYRDKPHTNDNFNYSNRNFTPLFDDGLVILCTKKKVEILKDLYSKGFKASLKQLKAATRTLNDDVFYVVFNELNRLVIANYTPMIVEELCCYSKIEPIKFLFEKIGIYYMTQTSLNKCLINSVNSHSKWSKLDIFKYMLDLGADIKYNNYEVFESIFGYGHTDILEFLYENYTDLDKDVEYDLRKYVDIAVKYNKVDVIRYLIESNNYSNDRYNLKEDKKLIEEYCSQFNKNKEVLEYLIKSLYGHDKEYIGELKLKFPRQRKLQEFLTTLI